MLGNATFWMWHGYCTYEVMVTMHNIKATRVLAWMEEGPSGFHFLMRNYWQTAVEERRNNASMGVPPLIAFLCSSGLLHIFEHMSITHWA